MSFKKLTAATALIAGLSFNVSANATEVSLEQFVAATMSHVLETTKHELENNVHKAVLTANNMISFDESEQYATKVTIKDIESQEEQPSKAE